VQVGVSCVSFLPHYLVFQLPCGRLGHPVGHGCQQQQQQQQQQQEEDDYYTVTEYLR
jgi:hypothetical protein